MTKEQTKKLIPIWQAWIEGKPLQWFTMADRWEDFPSDTNLNWEVWRDKVRIKPEPREFWINVYENGVSSHIYPSRATADSRATSDREECIHVREVLND